MASKATAKSPANKKKQPVDSLVSAAGKPVVIVIDAVFDFMSPDGAFARHFGTEDTAPIHNLLPELDLLLDAAHKLEFPTVLVASSYPEGTFSVKGLCSSDEGRALVVAKRHIATASLHVLKSHNSLLQCDNRSELLELVANRRVLLAGTTTVACVSKAVSVLKRHCAQITVARNAVACRAHSHRREAMLFKQWENGGPKVGVVEDWQEFVHETTAANDEEGANIAPPVESESQPATKGGAAAEKDGKFTDKEADKGGGKLSTTTESAPDKKEVSETQKDV